MEVKDNIFARQFETIVPEGLLTVEYSLQEKKIFLTKFTSPDGFTDENSTQQFFKTILDNIRSRDLKAVPILPKIVQFFKKNPSYKELLPPGIRL
jgi:hypothetical protein